MYIYLYIICTLLYYVHYKAQKQKLNKKNEIKVKYTQVLFNLLTLQKFFLAVPGRVCTPTGVHTFPFGDHWFSTPSYTEMHIHTLGWKSINTEI